VDHNIGKTAEDSLKDFGNNLSENTKPPGTGGDSTNEEKNKRKKKEKDENTK